MRLYSSSVMGVLLCYGKKEKNETSGESQSYAPMKTFRLPTTGDVFPSQKFPVLKAKHFKCLIQFANWIKYVYGNYENFLTFFSNAKYSKRDYGICLHRPTYITSTWNSTAELLNKSVNLLMFIIFKILLHLFFFLVNENCWMAGKRFLGFPCNINCVKVKGNN